MACLIAKKLKFYSRKDEDAFFDWLKKIECVQDASGAKDELFIDVVSLDIHDHDLRDLLALFYRYDIEMVQLSRFLNASNKEWFYNNKIAYWYKQVFR